MTRRASVGRWARLALGVWLTLGLAGLEARAAADGMRIAVLEFGAAGGDASLASLGKGLQSMITTDLAQVQRFTLVERARLTEIEKELALGKSGLVDKKTAAKLGKLAGASHLLSGTFTVVGEQMRLDAQLFVVKSGEILLAEKMEGDREAFFELEKELVRKLVGALGVKLEPRERAAVGKVHTADFEAFRHFSRGVEAFDAEKWDDAVAALREAASRDAEFTLAKVTLAEYEGIIARLRTRADQLQSARQELERLERLKKQSTEAAVAERLFSVASGKDGRLRLAATLALAVNYAPLGSNQGRLLTLRGTEDRFAMQRTADAMVKAYVAEALTRFPAVPTLPDDGLVRALPEGPEAVDAWVAKLADALEKEGSNHPENRKNLMLNALRYPRPTARRLHLDVAQTTALAERLFELGQKLEPGDFWRDEQRELLVDLYRETLDLDRATALLTRWSAETDNPYKLEGFAREIEKNRDLAMILAAAGRHDAPVRELMRAQLGKLSPRVLERMVTEHFAGDRLGPPALYELNRGRAFPSEDAVLLGDLPAWALQGHFWLSTGARTDARRGQGLRYYREATRDPFDALTMVGAAPLGDLTARFRLEATPAADWWPRNKKPRAEKSLKDVALAAGRPAVAFMFGLTDVDCRPKDRPMSGYAVVFGESAVQVVRMAETARGSFDRKTAFSHEVLAEGRLDRGAKPLDVEVTVRGTQVTVKAGGQTVKATLPTAAQGFQGFRFMGDGYAGVEALEVKP